jgi:undecaprenyl-diphosphatase
MLNIDVNLFFLINRGMANALFDVLMPALSAQGYLLVLPFLFSAVLRGYGCRRPSGRTCLSTAVAAVLIACIAVALADYLTDVLKMLAARPRPCQALEGVRLRVSCPRSYSFPSSHAATSFAGAVPLFLLTRRFLPLAWRLYPLALAAAVACSRPYLGVHYPSDALAGALLGAMIAGVPCWLFWMVSLRERKE